MLWSLCVLCLFASLALIFQFPQVNAGAGDGRPLSAVHTKAKYVIPKEIAAGDDKMKEFEAVSSHGRDGDELFRDQLLPSTYQVFARACYLFLLFSPMALTSVFAYLSPLFRSSVWYALMRFAIAQGGAAFIKWAQWASTRPDVFPEDLCDMLASLQSDAPEHSYSFTSAQIKKELGASIEEVFDEFSPRPVASGSIAQVYKAILNGQTVAVKVRHPNVEEQIEIDFIIMKAIARFVESLPGMKWLNLSESLAQFSSTISGQVHLDIEGRHLYLFSRNFRGWKTVGFPKPIILTNSVLVETFEIGESVAKYMDKLLCKPTAMVVTNEEELEAAIRQCELAHFVVTTGEDTYLKMLLQDNLMHADLHPGNILIEKILHPAEPSEDETDVDEVVESESIKGLKIVLVDAGMIAKLVPEERYNFIGLMESMGEGRGDEAADYVMKFSSKGHTYDDETRQAFRKDMKELFDRVCRGYGYDVDIGVTLRGILHLIRVHHITIEANYATLVMNVLCLDSMARALLPTYNILDGGKPLLRYNRSTKHLPGSSVVTKAAIPAAQWMKRKSDRLFLERLKRDLRSRLAEHKKAVSELTRQANLKENSPSRL